MRIIVESAGIYTAQLIVAFVLILVDHPVAFLVHYILAPSMGEAFKLVLDVITGLNTCQGIVFVLLNVRAHSLGE